MTALWIRHETRPTERRAPLVPADARLLVAAGVDVTVEHSPQRVFPTEDYAEAGCAVAPAGSWVSTPADTVVVGLKELPDAPAALRHRHVYFGHAYKGQHGARDLLDRFVRGGGALLDLEYLTDEHGRRLTAFGYWAGYVGAALAVLHSRGVLAGPLRPCRRAELDAALTASVHRPAGTALVIGARGRCGRGALDALAVAGVPATAWDIAETRVLDRHALLRHDILVNTVLATEPIPPFVTWSDMYCAHRALRVISDVSCDVTSACHALPIYRLMTDWTTPARRLRDGPVPLDVIAIDNLPSLLPEEASAAFSADLAPLLLDLDTSAAWRRTRTQFTSATKELSHV